MGSELVRYEGQTPVFAEAVSDFASAVLHPLFGLGRLASRVLAVRAESKRLRLEEIQGGREHRERMQKTRLQAEVLDRHSSRLHEANLESIRAMERADARKTEIALRQIETNYDLALGAIHLDGEVRRYEIDRRMAGVLAQIDATLRVDLQRLADARRKNDQVFALLRRQANALERAQRDLRLSLDLVMQQVDDPLFRPMALQAIVSLGQATPLLFKYHGDGMAAVAEALSNEDEEPIGRWPR